jgi:hypothetical protein
MGIKSKMRFWPRWLPASLLCGPVMLSGQSPPPLSKADFSLAGVNVGADSSAVRRGLGQPDSVRFDPNPFSPKAKSVVWVYRRYTILFYTTEHVAGVRIRDASVATRRGLRLGDSVARLKELYGEPTGAYQESVEYQDPKQKFEVLRVVLKDGRVEDIYIGALLH